MTFSIPRLQLHFLKFLHFCLTASLKFLHVCLTASLHLRRYRIYGRDAWDGACAGFVIKPLGTLTSLLTASSITAGMYFSRGLFGARTSTGVGGAVKSPRLGVTDILELFRCCIGAGVDPVSAGVPELWIS